MGDRVVDVDELSGPKMMDDECDADIMYESWEDRPCLMLDANPGWLNITTDPNEAPLDCREPEPGAPTEVVDDDDTTLPIIEHGRLRR
jgi:hypothetical protein